jgi:hypothetical protein
MQTNFVVAHQQEIDLLQHGARKLIKSGKNSGIRQGIFTLWWMT